jgi:hypothetical protein
MKKFNFFKPGQAISLAAATILLFSGCSKDKDKDSTSLADKAGKEYCDCINNNKGQKLDDCLEALDKKYDQYDEEFEAAVMVWLDKNCAGWVQYW